MDFNSYKELLKTNYPQAYSFAEQKGQKALFFESPVHLSKNIYAQIKQSIHSLYRLRNSKTYQNSLPKFQDSLFLENKKQDSVLMAYDFHLDNETAKLIEVNTNGSAFLIVNTLYQFKNLDYKKALEDLKNSFQEEWAKFNKNLAVPKKAVLIDEDPFNQKMALEFFMYKDFFQSMGWNMEILDSKKLKMDDSYQLYTPSDEKIDFIYNRTTDFYFKNHPPLAKACQKNTCLISPHPKDYYLLADKNRLIDWHSKNWEELKDIAPNLIKTKILNSENRQELWQNRKKYFFKICQGHGGKMAYKGASLTRKKFEDLLKQGCVAQEYIAPSQIKNANNQKWKLDLRAYVYKDHIQQLAGRVYQGQLTNFKAPGSGFTTVELY